MTHKTCHTCSFKHLTPIHNIPKCHIAKWYCRVTGRRMGDGTDKDMMEATGCNKWVSLSGGG